MLIGVYLEKGRVSDNPDSAETVISETPWMSLQLVVVVSSDTPLRSAKLLVVLLVHQVAPGWGVGSNLKKICIFFVAG